MGFSTTTAGGDVDQLFIGGSADPTASGNATLYNLDVTTYAVSAQLGGVDGSPELTGNANAELWGFFPSGTSTQAHIEQINKTNGTADLVVDAPGEHAGPGGRVGIRASTAATTGYSCRR